LSHEEGSAVAQRDQDESATSSTGQSPAETGPALGGPASELDPSMWRGLTKRRVSRRGLLRAGGLAGGATAGAGLLGAAGLSGFLAGCGVVQPAASATETVGSTAWWRKQKLHYTVNFANWPDYIDTLRNKHPSLTHFTDLTRIQVSYSEPINENQPFYDIIRPSLERREYIGYDIVVLTNSDPPLAEMIDNGWLIPLDQSMMNNFRAYAGSLVRSPSWDPGNTYTMAWQSGWTAIGYNSSVIKDPGDSVGILFDRKYAGKVGMLSDPRDLGCVGLLAIGVDPDTSTEAEWRRAAAYLQKQKNEGIVRGYYNQDYIDYLKNGEVVVSQAFSGDIFQANLQQQYKDLRLLMPVEGGMFWTDNMCIPMYAENPKDAMMLMDYFYQPQVEAVVEYYNDYVCPVPDARLVLLHPTGWAGQELAAMRPEIGEPPSYTANSPLVFPSSQYRARSKDYYQFQNAEELATWNRLFGAISAPG
jgi:spermidine/putrescine transport system substrate-binding protein